ncbi:ATP-binding protein [soil metagenome]
MPERVLILAPRGRDAQLAADLLHKGDIDSAVVVSLEELLEELQIGAAAALVADEALSEQGQQKLTDWLSAQPIWSDLPVVRLTTRPSSSARTPRANNFDEVGNVILLERPLSARSLVSACRAAVRQRRRQYATRQNLQELEDARRQVQASNSELELRIKARTKELAEANDRLTAEISQRERTQTELFQSQKMEALGRLTGGIAHDFNNVLHAVSMNLEILERLNPDPRSASVARRAVAAARRGATLTMQLLSFARNQSLLPHQVDVNRLLEGMKELIAVSLGPSIRLSWQLDSAGPVWTLVDATQLEMAVLNLAVNAKDAMPTGGTLTVSTRAPGRSKSGAKPGETGEVLISVADNGQGMSPSLVGKVFDPFFTTKPVGQGTGLGLSQVYGFARQSGGNATIRSEEGVGTVVDVFLPSVEATTGRPSGGGDVDSLAAVEAGDRASRRVLVVEDDNDVRRVLTDSLRLMSHEVVEAADGFEALRLLGQERVDLMLVDYAMPGMTGAELITQARDRFGPMPVILATGYADMAEVGKVLHTQSVLLKPFTFHDLRRVIATVRYDDPMKSDPPRAQPIFPA